ncbi:MAG: phosphatase PAP2 family protein [Bdellovibrionales bacterium]|nr:phosphatase PAP2 family protein [Bdellovibrionales bacterium]
MILNSSGAKIIEDSVKDLKDYHFPILLFFMMIITLFVLSPVDYQWTEHIRLFNNPFTKFMEQSFYEGERWGGVDLPVTAQGLAVIAYLIFELIPGLRKKQIKFRLRYLTLCSLTISLTLIHSLKNLIGRARPYKVAGFENIHFTQWYQPGDLLKLGLFGEGSFPSGHTASAFFLFAFLYAFKDKIQSKALLYLSTLTIFLFTILMAFSRVAIGDHWITDTIASVFLSWIGFDILYKKALKPKLNPPFEP